MATLYPVGLSATVGLAQRLSTKNFTPRCCVLDVVYTMLGTEVAGDVIRFGPLHQGDRVLPHLSIVTSDGIAATATVDIGDTGTTSAWAVLQAADVDRYADGLDVAAAGADLFTAGTAPAALVPQFDLLGDTWLTATLVTLATPVAGKKLRVVAFYTGA